MQFASILFENADDRRIVESSLEPAFFRDLNCDQIVGAITAGKDEYRLRAFFHHSLSRPEAIRYRQEVMRDLQNAALRNAIVEFAEAMRSMRDRLMRIAKFPHREQRWAWFLDAAEVYCECIRRLADDLEKLELNSRGFIGFRSYLNNCTTSVRFVALAEESAAVRQDLAAVAYCIRIKGNGFTVCNYQNESDYSAEVESTFERFKQGVTKDHLVQFRTPDDINHVEAKILEFVAKLNPQAFTALANFCTRQAEFIDQTIADFDREVQFYIGYLEYIEPLQRSGLPFCYPHITDEKGDVYSRGGFDIALAHKLVGEGGAVVGNDFRLMGRERILVITGPNQGGKTTFARAFGQLHYLASIGCPVPGVAGELAIFDGIFTHFEKEEKVENLRGKLESDLVQVRQILARVTERSIIIFNEIFTSTTIHDESFLSRKIMEEIVRLGVLCAWVTFVDELASFEPHTVSMVSTVAAENPSMRTFKIMRKRADGMAYAMAIAEKHGLTYERIKERMS